MTNVPRNIERRVESGANVRGLDVRNIELEEDTDDETVYKIVINDEDAPEGENPTFFAEHPNVSGGMNMFGERLENGLDQVRKRILGIEEEEENPELQETREKLEEAGHPRATGEEVDYGPGPRPNVEGVMDGGYDDGDISVRSTTEMDLPDVPERTQSGGNDSQDAPATQERGEHPSGENEQTDVPMERGNSQSNTAADGGELIPDGFWGDVADAALDAHELEKKGHQMASEALAREIAMELEGYLGDDDA